MKKTLYIVIWIIIYSVYSPYEIAIAKDNENITCLKTAAHESLNIPTAPLNQAFTYELNRGRFGDHLISLIKCLRFVWDYREYTIPILYQPFNYSSGFKIDALLPHLEHYSFEKNIYFKDNRTLQRSLKSSNTLFISSLYSLPAGASIFSPELYLSLTEPAFKNFIAPLFAPSKHFDTIARSPDRLNVALHVRKGEYEGALLSKMFLDQVWPLRFPPDSFYIKAIKFLSELYDDAPIYIFIFTDSSNPKAIADRYNAALNKPNIKFGYRDTSIGKNKFVLEDFFSILNFDCFIHPMSSYSQCATILGNFQVRIYPYKYHWQKTTLIIDESVMIKDNKAYSLQLKRKAS